MKIQVQGPHSGDEMGEQGKRSIVAESFASKVAGCDCKLFEILHSNEGSNLREFNMRNVMARVCIPHSVIFSPNRRASWYFTSAKTGDIMKKNTVNTIPTVISHSFQRYAHGRKTVARFIYSSGYKMGFGKTHIVNLSRKQMKELLFKVNTDIQFPHLLGVLQTTATKGIVYRVVWDGKTFTVLRWKEQREEKDGEQRKEDKMNGGAKKFQGMKRERGNQMAASESSKRKKNKSTLLSISKGGNFFRARDDFKRRRILKCSARIRDHIATSIVVEEHMSPLGSPSGSSSFFDGHTSSSGEPSTMASNGKAPLTSMRRTNSSSSAATVITEEKGEEGKSVNNEEDGSMKSILKGDSFSTFSTLRKRRGLEAWSPGGEKEQDSPTTTPTISNLDDPPTHGITETDIFLDTFLQLDPSGSLHFLWGRAFIRRGGAAAGFCSLETGRPVDIVQISRDAKAFLEDEEDDMSEVFPPKELGRHLDSKIDPHNTKKHHQKQQKHHKTQEAGKSDVAYSHASVQLNSAQALHVHTRTQKSPSEEASQSVKDLEPKNKSTQLHKEATPMTAKGKDKTARNKSTGRNLKKLIVKSSKYSPRFAADGNGSFTPRKFDIVLTPKSDRKMSKLNIALTSPWKQENNKKLDDSLIAEYLSLIHSNRPKSQPRAKTFSPTKSTKVRMKGTKGIYQGDLDPKEMLKSGLNLSDSEKAELRSICSGMGKSSEGAKSARSSRSHTLALYELSKQKNKGLKSARAKTHLMVFESLLAEMNLNQLLNDVDAKIHGESNGEAVASNSKRKAANHVNQDKRGAAHDDDGKQQQQQSKPSPPALASKEQNRNEDRAKNKRIAAQTPDEHHTLDDSYGDDSLISPKAAGSSSVTPKARVDGTDADESYLDESFMSPQQRTQRPGSSKFSFSDEAVQPKGTGSDGGKLDGGRSSMKEEESEAATSFPVMPGRQPSNTAVANDKKDDANEKGVNDGGGSDTSQQQPPKATEDNQEKQDGRAKDKKNAVTAAPGGLDESLGDDSYGDESLVSSPKAASAKTFNAPTDAKKTTAAATAKAENVIHQEAHQDSMNEKTGHDESSRDNNHNPTDELGDEGNLDLDLSDDDDDDNI